MTQFALISDLQAAGVAIPNEAAAQWALSAASDHLTLVIGPLAITARTINLSLHQYEGDRWLQIPVALVQSITSMIVNGVVVANPVFVDGAVEVTNGPCDVALVIVAGTDVIPAELVTWTVVLAAEALSSLGDFGFPGSATVTSVAMEDFKKTWVPGGGAFSLPPRVEGLLRNRDGPGGSVVVGVR